MNEPRPSTTIRPGCKVNLYLEITARLENGYHELHTLFFPLPLPTDELTITPQPAGQGLTLSSSDPELETPANTVARAYAAFAARTGHAPGLAVHLDKGVPMGAGLGGGSADAGALLRYLNEQAGDNALPADDLNALAVGIGADVPFFLQDAPAWARGVGEQLFPTTLDLKGFTLLLLCPGVHIPSAWAYTTFDAYHALSGKSENSRDFLTCGTEKIKSSPCPRLLLRNSFECVAYREHPKLRQYKEKLLRLGAAGAVMSGSGSSILALYRHADNAREAKKSFESADIPVFLHDFQ